MIHDIILCLLEPNSVNTSLSTYLRTYGDNLHPSEIQILKEIIKCAKIHQTIRQFVEKYSSNGIGMSSLANNGIYLKSFATGVANALKVFRKKMLSLESEHIKNSCLPINYFLTQIKEFQTFFHFLNLLVNEIETQKLHGCAILGLLHKYGHHADAKCSSSLKTIRLSVSSVFLRQLSQWLIYGNLVDFHTEFFIIHNNYNKNTDTSMELTATPNTLQSDGTYTRSELYFQISYDMIPANFTASFAENVLFIGQTVRMLVNDPWKIMRKKMSIWNEEEDDLLSTEQFGSLWNGKEHFFLNKIQGLLNCNNIDNGSYEYVVNEIKQYVTERLSEIAFNQADLMKHLKLFKDYYLLGRGELFLEFIMQLKSIEIKSNITENLAREISQAFQKALSLTSIDTDQMTVSYALSSCTNLIDCDNENDKDGDDNRSQIILKAIRLKIQAKWPLHLFFSTSRVLDQYNELFSFLLQIRQIQNGLHDVWRLHREQKIAGNSMLSQLRNKMLFLIDNLQYYLHVDVIESQFCILMNAVQSSKDFEFIQRAHNVFQTNVMSLSFLLNANAIDATTNRYQSQNPVQRILNKIFKTIRSFCKFIQDTNVQISSSESYHVVGIFYEQFSNHIKELLSMLSNRTAGPNSEPLSQLLVRLDFNHWFSSYTD